MPGRTQTQSVVNRPLRVRTRGDLQHVAMSLAATAAYVVKDPVTLELFHLTAEENYLLEQLKSRTTLAELRERFQNYFAPRTVSIAALDQGVQALYQRGLLLADAAGQGEQLHERATKRRRQEWLASLASVISFRFGSFDATWLVDNLYRCTRWMFSPAAIAAAIAVVLYALTILLTNASAIAARLPTIAELSAPRYWLLWIGTIAAVKVVHELAHALTCKHFGGRCHEIGVMLLAMVPCLYCDVSDVWRLPSKWQRIAVSAAGMAAELVIAAAAVIAWWHTPPGLFNSLCLGLVVVCSVGTLLVNANPLLRYDGYYILSDLAEVPNLGERARGLLPERLRHWLTAEPIAEDPLLNRRRRRGLWVYAVAAKCYMVLVVMTILALFVSLALPHRLENAVYAFGMLAVAGMAMQPTVASWRAVRNPLFRRRVRVWRVGLLLLVAAGVVAAVGLVPIPRYVTGPAVLVPRDGRVVYASASGRLIDALPPGSVVASGDVIANLASDAVQLAVVRSEGELQLSRTRYEQLQSLQAFNPKYAAQIPTARATLDAAAGQLAEQRRDQERLTITAPIAGRIVEAPSVAPTAEVDRLPRWWGSPLELRNRGCYLQPGDVVCVVAADEVLEALVAIDQADVSELTVGQAVRLRFDAVPLEHLAGEVTQIAERGQTFTDAAAGAPVIDASRYHLAVVQLNAADARLPIGSRGVAKIETLEATLWQRTRRALGELLHLPW